MKQAENEGFTACKKFKSSHEKSEFCCGRHKDNVLPLSKAEAGLYFLGPDVKKYIRAPVPICLSRKKGTDSCYLMKILVLDDSNSRDKCSLVRRTAFHNEYSILSLLKNCPGVIQIHDFFKDHILSDDGGRILKRVCLVLECVIPHGHHNIELIPLNLYLKEKILSELEALHIFYNLLLVIEELHRRNIVHRDLKLSNVILNRKTLKVKLMDFYYAKLLTSSREDPCRSLSTEALLGQEAFPKTCDMWSAGVIFYALLNAYTPLAAVLSHGSSQSSNRSLRDIYMKITENDCDVLNNTAISTTTREFLKSIFCKIPQYRLKVSEALDKVSVLIAIHSSSLNSNLFEEKKKCSDQIVPECPEFDSKDSEESNSKKFNSPPYNETLTERGDSISERTDDYDIENLSSSPSKSSQQNGLSDLNGKSEDIRVAMLRLGVTSVNSINALSFSYSKKNTCRS